MSRKVWVVGGGLAGSEAAWQLAEAGLGVSLFEMRPLLLTPAHQSGDLAELVCSNSLKAEGLENACGLMKEEMRYFNSLVMQSADQTRVPAGRALAVDRELFSKRITEVLENHPRIEVIREEISEVPEAQPAVVATGPLTSKRFSEWLEKIFGERHLSFYDAVAPIVTRESLDFSTIFSASRYEEGEGDYLNCPLNEEEYRLFWENLIGAQTHEPHLPEEKRDYFEGCVPLETLASRGSETLRYGPLKPVGLINPRTRRRPYAVLQLRPENREKTLYNLVGFQTNLRWTEQSRVFRMIPGLKNAEFVRFGVMHRNTFINSPALLRSTLQWKERDNLFFAGQLIGVEGYVESAAAGLVAGLNMARWLRGKDPVSFPNVTATGALLEFITTAEAKYFQPMNINFGLLPPLTRRVKKRTDRNRELSTRALAKMEEFIQEEFSTY